MFTRTFRTLKKSVQTIYYAKFPILYPNIYPDQPTEADYEALGVSSNVNNRELVMIFREKSFYLHPAVNLTVEAVQEYDKLVKAYDRIVMYRMAQEGIPQPYNTAFYPPETHTKKIRNFIDENVFWTFHVHEQYNRLLLTFYIIFGILHTFCQGEHSLLKNPDL